MKSMAGRVRALLMMRAVGAACYVPLIASLAACGGGNVSTTAAPVSAVMPTIVTQPQNQAAAVGQTATFAVTASGSPPLSYQWQRGGTAITGATLASYTTPPVTAADGGAVLQVVISNPGGVVTSRGATLTVTTPVASPPRITMQPVSQGVTVGQTASFTVAATGSAPLSYQWSRAGTAIAGATSAGYTTPAATVADNGASFTVLVSNALGSATSAPATLSVTGPVAGPPTITTQPVSQGVTVGQTASFTVAATGSAPLTYQWSRAGTAIAGATSAGYTTPAATGADNGASFTVLVSNALGSAMSAPAILSVTVPMSSVDVVTYKNDVARTGQNLNEVTLTLTNVAAATFGLLRTLPVDGKVDAQPLYVSALTLLGALHDVVYVATEHDSVYGFDANNGSVLWKTSLLGPGESLSDTHGCGQVVPEIGVTSTPVIDRTAGVNGTLFVVAMSKDKSSVHHQRIHALDLTTGAELLGGPVEIAASYPNASGSTDFDPGQYEERAALLLVNGTIITTWTSHCDAAPYTGWIIAYSETTLARTSVLNVAPNSGAGPAIWMAGGGPAADAAGNIYLLTANGAFETTLDANGFPRGQDFGNSFLRLSAGPVMLSVADYFTMSNEVEESAADQDLGSGGSMLLPDLSDVTHATKHLVVGAGKDGNLYLVDRDSMGRYDPASNHIWQQLTGALRGGIFSTPAYFNGRVYYGPVSGSLKAFTLANAKLSAVPASQSSTQFAYPGTAPSVSANGTSNAILWAHENTNPAVLHAYDATNLGIELYHSNQAAGGRDHFGMGNKFISPMIAHGKVFVGTPSSVAVFGLLH